MTDKEKLIKYLFIVSVIGAGKERIWQLLDTFGSPVRLYDALIKSANSDNNGIFNNDELKNAKRTHTVQLDGIISYCVSHNIGILCFDDADYPQRLLGITNPPFLLFYKGNADILNNNVIITVVGARSLSKYSHSAAEAIAKTAAENDIAVASGFAVGTDITAQLAAADAGGKVISVLGCGIDYDYPAENIIYRDRLLSNGVFISEYFPQTAAKPPLFIARNRILTGLAVGTVIIEASEKSGSLNSAECTVSQGRDLWVVPPHDIFDPRYDGNKILLKSGAMPLCSPYDIVGEYFENHHHKSVGKNNADNISLSKTDNKNDTSHIVQKPMVQKTKSEKAAPRLDERAEIIYNILISSPSPVSADEAAEAADMDIMEVLSILTDMEIDGIVSSDMGDSYYIT